MSVLLTSDRKRFYVLHSQSFSWGFGLENILKKLGDIFKISFRQGTGNVSQSLSPYYSFFFILTEYLIIFT